MKIVLGNAVYSGCGIDDRELIYLNQELVLLQIIINILMQLTNETLYFIQVKNELYFEPIGRR